VRELSPANELLVQATRTRRIGYADAVPAPASPLDMYTSSLVFV
jgi:hypothetical protein